MVFHRSVSSEGSKPWSPSESLREVGRTGVAHIVHSLRNDPRSGADTTVSKLPGRPGSLSGHAALIVVKKKTVDPTSTQEVPHGVRSSRSEHVPGPLLPESVPDACGYQS